MHPITPSLPAFTPEVIAEIEHLLVGCGGFVKELLAYTQGASTQKDDLGQRLSAADCLVDRLLREQLLRLVPHSGGYSEEGGEFGQRDAPAHWLLDPLDGTRPAILGGAYAVSIGALIRESGVPIGAIGWVYLPTLARLYRGILAPELREATVNGTPAHLASVTSPADLSRRYLLTGSDWHRVAERPYPLKHSAIGATAVHLVQLVHPDSDAAATVLTRYRAYDAAGAIPVAAAAGASIYPLNERGWPEAQPLDPLTFLAEGTKNPSDFGPRVLVCSPEVHELLPGSADILSA